MLDIKFIRENQREVEKTLEKRGVKLDLGHLLEIDDERLKLIKEVEALRHDRNIAADSHDEEKGREIKGNLSKLESALSAVDTELNDYLEQVPNLISPDVPEGKDEEDNVE